MICNNIQTSISLWKEYLETVIENNNKIVQVKKTLIIGWALMVSKNYLNEPLWLLRIRTIKNRENKYFLIDNKKWLCEHGGFHPMIARNRNYIPENVYKHMKETFIKKWKFKSLLGLVSS